MATSAALMGAALATFVTLAATQGGCTTPSLTASVSVFCQAFRPILVDDIKSLDELPIDVAERIVRHNAAYRELCVEKGIFGKIRDVFTGGRP